MIAGYTKFLLGEGIWNNSTTNCRLEWLHTFTYKHTNFNTSKIDVGTLDYIDNCIKVKELYNVR